MALTLAGLLHRYRGSHREGRPYVSAALDLAGEHDFPQLVAWSCVSLLPAAVERGDFADADRCYERGLAAARSIRDPATMAHLGEARADSLQLRGRTVEARQVLERLLTELQISGVESFIPHLHFRLAVILAGEDDGAAVAQIEQIGASPEVTPSHRFLMATARSWSAVSMGPAVDAIPVVERAVSVVRAHGTPRNVAEQLCLLGLVQLGVDLARATDACHEALTVAFEAGLLPWVADALDGVAACEAGRGADADAVRLHAAADCLRDQSAPRLPVLDGVLRPVEAEVRHRLGSAWPEAAAEGRGMTVAEAVLVARRNRGRRNRPTTGWASLTPTEDQVVALAAQGLTNAQIAGRLFVGPGTVKSHLAHAYMKLQVANRTELAAAVARRHPAS